MAINWQAFGALGSGFLQGKMQHQQEQQQKVAALAQALIEQQNKIGFMNAEQDRLDKRQGVELADKAQERDSKDASDRLKQTSDLMSSALPGGQLSVADALRPIAPAGTDLSPYEHVYDTRAYAPLLSALLTHAYTQQENQAKLPLEGLKAAGDIASTQGTAFAPTYNQVVQPALQQSQQAGAGSVTPEQLIAGLSKVIPGLQGIVPQGAVPQEEIPPQGAPMAQGMGAPLPPPTPGGPMAQGGPPPMYPALPPPVKAALPGGGSAPPLPPPQSYPTGLRGSVTAPSPALPPLPPASAGAGAGASGVNVAESLPQPLPSPAQKARLADGTEFWITGQQDGVITGVTTDGRKIQAHASDLLGPGQLPTAALPPSPKQLEDIRHNKATEGNAAAQVANTAQQVANTGAYQKGELSNRAAELDLQKKKFIHDTAIDWNKLSLDKQKMLDQAWAADAKTHSNINQILAIQRMPLKDFLNAKGQEDLARYDASDHVDRTLLATGAVLPADQAAAARRRIANNDRYQQGILADAQKIRDGYLQSLGSGSGGGAGLPSGLPGGLPPMGLNFGSGGPASAQALPSTLPPGISPLPPARLPQSGDQLPGLPPHSTAVPKANGRAARPTASAAMGGDYLIRSPDGRITVSSAPAGQAPVMGPGDRNLGPARYNEKTKGFELIPGGSSQRGSSQRGNAGGGQAQLPLMKSHGGNATSKTSTGAPVRMKKGKANRILNHAGDLF